MRSFLGVVPIVRAKFNVHRTLTSSLIFDLVVTVADAHRHCSAFLRNRGAVGFSTSDLDTVLPDKNFSDGALLLILEAWVNSMHLFRRAPIVASY